jgi:uncharacterized membrane protein
MKLMSLLLGLCLLISACAKKPVYPEAPSDSTSIRIALADIPEKMPRFLTYTAGTRKINFFLLRRNGDVESYFDACGKCYPRKLGFRLEKERVICRTCGVSYDLEDLKEGIGSCYPIKLKGRVEGNTFVLDKKEVLKGEKFF